MVAGWMVHLLVLVCSLVGSGAVDGCHNRLDIDGARLEEADDPLASLLCEVRGAGCLAIPPFLGGVFRSSKKVARRYRSCAIVGSSGAATSVPYGKAIDSAELVVRFNDAPAGGQYSAAVGSRTDFRVGNDGAYQLMLTEGSGIIFYPSWQLGWPWLGWPDGSVGNFCTEAMPQDQKQSGARPLRCLEVSPRFLELLVNVIAAQSNRPKANYTSANKRGVPSAGFVGILSLINICDETNLYGFEMCREGEGHQISNLDPETCGSIRTGRCTPRSDVAVSTRVKYCRYFPSNQPQPNASALPTTGHSFEAEHAAIAKLEEFGLVKRWR